MSNYNIIVPISNEPVYGFKRTATMATLQINALPWTGQNINLITQVNYFDQNDVPIDIIPPKIVSLIADNSTCVDNKGDIIPCDSPDAVMTEFEYYMSLLNTPVVIEALVVGKIQQADAAGRFN
jgi:hypothetical protein